MIIDHTKTCKSKDYILASDEKFYTALISMKLFYGCITRSHHKKQSLYSGTRSHHNVAFIELHN